MLLPLFHFLLEAFIGVDLLLRVSLVPRRSRPDYTVQLSSLMHFRPAKIRRLGFKTRIGELRAPSELRVDEGDMVGEGRSVEVGYVKRRRVEAGRLRASPLFLQAA